MIPSHRRGDRYLHDIHFIKKKCFSWGLPTEVSSTPWPPAAEHQDNPYDKEWQAKQNLVAAEKQEGGQAEYCTKE